MTGTWVSAVGRTSARRVASERSSLLVTAVFYAMVASVLAGIWQVAASENDGRVVGYSAVALAWYAATAEMGTIALPMRLMEEIGDDIGSGRFQVELLRPRRPLWVRVVEQLGRCLPRLGVCVVAGIVLATVIGGAPPSSVALALGAPALLLAVAVNLVVQHAFAGAAFWLREAKGTWFLYQKMYFVLGGMLLPLEVLPTWLETIARASPFAAMAYVPARLASGHVEPELLLLQLGWLALALVVAGAVYRAGERRIVEVGG